MHSALETMPETLLMRLQDLQREDQDISLPKKVQFLQPLVLSPQYPVTSMNTPSSHSHEGSLKGKDMISTTPGSSTRLTEREESLNFSSRKMTRGNLPISSRRPRKNITMPSISSEQEKSGQQSEGLWPSSITDYMGKQKETYIIKRKKIRVANPPPLSPSTSNNEKLQEWPEWGSNNEDDSWSIDY
ncbi:uncharacterized protein BT62DRAFT_923688 [Guyanagaster necrorhizus]|uniref:Uncharacterized protein n=1 Tax=Guyanagaster necrorhizus TaxID=856835 RepID=A0A9P8AMJ6_9AGAR|nr:uncharacterized protein BT62DRAFT_923688 [Guyanagaster necrorhizus MCA 3950]KAG7440809.1 hypothetical protein BT62DRAFT_923688 [Guyanagaster necrorhizus MCA 3950]